MSRVGLAALVLAAGSTGTSPAAAASPTARYTVRFEATWSATTHPLQFPANAHWSPLVGGTHGPAVSFWDVGAPASLGIKDMAERGLTTPLANEVQAAIGAGTAGEVVLGSGIATSPGTATATFDVTQAYPRATVVSMIAPSPDWFVGVSGYPLLQNGDWVNLAYVPLFAYDAGTDSGTFYTAPNQATIPPEPIAPNGAPPFANGVPLGLFVFTRIDAPNPAAVPAASGWALAIAALALLVAGGLRARPAAGRL